MSAHINFHLIDPPLPVLVDGRLVLRLTPRGIDEPHVEAQLAISFDEVAPTAWLDHVRALFTKDAA